MKQLRQESSYKKLNELRKSETRLKMCLNFNIICCYHFLLFRNATLCDAIIKTADGDNIHAHKCILMSNCKYFEKMFLDKSEENDQKCIHILDIDSDILHNLIDYIYTGTFIQIHMENITVIIFILLNDS